MIILNLILKSGPVLVAFDEECMCACDCVYVTARMVVYTCDDVILSLCVCD